MRVSVILSSLALLFIAASYYLLPPARGEIKDQIDDLRQHLKRAAEPVATVHLADLAPYRTDASLVDPARHLPHVTEDPPAEIRAAYRLAKTCTGDPALPSSKLLTWTRYACGLIPELPENFLKAPPYVHPSGASYAKLLQDKTKAPVPKEYLHVLELKELDAAQLTESEKIWTALDPDQLQAAYFHSDFALGDTYVLVPVKGDSDDSRMAFAVYRTATLLTLVHDRYLVAVREMAVRARGKLQGNIIWSTDDDRLATRRLVAALLAGSGALLLTGTIIALTRRLTRERRAAFARRSFNLQLLSHELRSPATALKLSLNPL